MNNNLSPILSICIPTYNRMDCLKECLQSIINSAHGFEDKLEIFILDNASTDKTSNVVDEFKNKYSFIKYNRNSVCIEVNKNIYTVASLGSGEYIWVLGDDDIISEKAIPQIFKLIDLGFTLIATNHSIWSKDFSTILTQNAISYESDIIFNNHNKLLSKLGLRLGFISGVIIKKDLFFIQTLNEVEKYMEYGFSFLYAVYSGIGTDCKGYFISKPLVRQRAGNSNYDTVYWYKLFAVGSSTVFTQLRNCRYSIFSIFNAKNLVLHDYIIHDISFRRRNNINMHGIFSMIAPYYKWHPFFWLLCVPGLFAPDFLVSLAHFMFTFSRNQKVVTNEKNS